MTLSSTTRARRSAFTLVELLVAITVIGVLVGMLAAAIFPAMKRANEFAVQTELMQIEQAFEKFKIEFGTYPPSFVKLNLQDADGDGDNWSGEDAAGVAMGGGDSDDPIIILQQYLNVIAPNHQENLVVAGTTGYPETRLEIWWDEIGQHIGYDHGDDVVFWLSGLCKNSQFPLTASADSTVDEATFRTGLLNAFGSGSSVERWVFYDFNDGQLEFEPAGAVSGASVAHYRQPKGKDSPFLYIDSSSYGLDIDSSGSTPIDGVVGFDGYQIAVRSSGTVTERYYENPTTFQLVTFGMDGKGGNVNDDTRGEWVDAGPDGQDNLSNFTEGRLDRLILGTIKSTSKYQ